MSAFQHDLSVGVGERCGLLLLAAAVAVGLSACGTSVPQPLPGAGNGGGTAGTGNAGTGMGAGTGGGAGTGVAGGWAGTNAAGGCIVDGAYYDVGQSFPASDGCNSCTCYDDGQAACTEIGCMALLCGGRAGMTCAMNEYCRFEPEAICGRADANGSCVVRPEACGEIYSPVCGCDGSTYSNACEAAVAGVSVDTLGACDGGLGCKEDFDCPQPSCPCLDEDMNGGCENHCPTFGCRDGQCVDVSGEVPCGGWNPKACPSDQFCNYPESATCGAADGSGVCKLTPTTCTAELLPVCGCDGKTYSNACGANIEGISVLHTGKCN